MLKLLSILWPILALLAVIVASAAFRPTVRWVFLALSPAILCAVHIGNTGLIVATTGLWSLLLPVFYVGLAFAAASSFANRRRRRASEWREWRELPAWRRLAMVTAIGFVAGGICGYVGIEVRAHNQKVHGFSYRQYCSAENVAALGFIAVRRLHDPRELEYRYAHHWQRDRHITAAWNGLAFAILASATYAGYRGVRRILNS